MERKFVECIVFDEDEQRDFSRRDIVPITTGMDMAYSFIETAKRLQQKAEELTDGDTEAVPTLDSAMIGIEVTTLEKRADDLTEFGAQILALCSEEIRAMPPRDAES